MTVGFATDVVTIDEFSILNELRKRYTDSKFINLNELLFKPIPGTYKNIGDLDVEVVINRTRSASQREYSTRMFEEAGIEVLNPYGVEWASNLKTTTKDAFNAYNIDTIDYVLIPSFPMVRTRDGKYRLIRDNAKKIAETVLNKFGKTVLKPVGGSWGKSIISFDSIDGYLKECIDTYQEYRKTGTLRNYSLYQCLNNPFGTYAEKFVPHALDLRIVVEKKPGKKPKVLGCLVRAVSDDNIVAKNTARGAIPLGIETPHEYRSLTIESIEAIIGYANTHGHKVDYLIGGIDIIPMCEDKDKREKVYEAVRKISQFKRENIDPAKKMVDDLLDKWSRRRCTGEKLEKALRQHDKVYAAFRSLPGYSQLQEVVGEYISQCKPYVNEFNPRPDFRNNTHNVAYSNLPTRIIEVAVSHII